MSEFTTRDLPALKAPFEWVPVGHRIFILDENGVPIVGDDGDFIVDPDRPLICASLYARGHWLGKARFYSALQGFYLYTPDAELDLSGEWWLRYTFDLDYTGVKESECFQCNEHPTMALARHFDALVDLR